jgi:mannose-1-phosphate guanylyltransferase
MWGACGTLQIVTSQGNEEGQVFENYYAVIMAGGSGTRLWPLSRQGHPKQSLVFEGERTLFQWAVKRLEGLFPFEHILVVTVAEQVQGLREQCPEIPPDNFVIEPLPRGTASVAGLAAIAVKNRDPNGVMAILTADHLIKNDVHLRHLLKAAYQVAQENYLVTLGITPTFPATGYGYIQIGTLIDRYEGLEVFRVEKFKEKPNLEQAEAYTSDGMHLWNSGMFVWRTDTVLAALRNQMPDLYAKLEKIDSVWQGGGRDDVLNIVWPRIQPQTIDYGIMESASNAAVVPTKNLGWNDVGSWESLFDALGSDTEGNIILKGETAIFDTQGTLICGDSTDRLIVTMGVKDLVIIESGNSILVCARDQAQHVRDIVDYLKREGRVQYL